MTELSRLRGSEGYAVRADEAQGSKASFQQSALGLLTEAQQAGFAQNIPTLTN